jgi:hypothetical protein
MKHLNLQVIVAAAMVAAMLGGATVGFGRKKLTYLKPIAGGAITASAAFVAINLLQMMKKMKTDLHWIADKCSYIEQRIDKAAAKSGDICRHLQQVFVNFDADKNAAKTMESKFWWVERRLRDLYEDFSNSKAMEKCNYEVVRKTWSMLQLEVKMRTLRNVVAMRHAAGAKDHEDLVGMEWALKNMEAAAQQCSFWKPMDFNALENHKAQSCFEEILISSIDEKMKEVKQYVEGDVSLKFAGLNLGGLTAASSDS